MILNGDEIIEAHNTGKIKIDPWDEKKVGTNSYDVTLLPTLKYYRYGTLDPRTKNLIVEMTIPETGLLLEKGTFWLGSTYEYNSNISNDLVPMLEGRSSVARLGLTIHVTAGFGDIGFCGRWTLELIPAVSIVVYPYMPIGQLYWIRTRPTTRQYHGKYQNQTEVQESKLYTER
jgi:dCTP deaminase